MFIPIWYSRRINKDARSAWLETLAGLALGDSKKEGFLPHKFVFERDSEEVGLGTKLSIRWTAGLTVEEARVTRWEPTRRMCEVEISRYGKRNRSYRYQVESLGNGTCIRKLYMRLYFKLDNAIELVIRVPYWLIYARKAAALKS